VRRWPTGRADFTPVFLSRDPEHVPHDRELPLDVALVQVSLPDEHGYCRLGVSVACAAAPRSITRAS
jgi:acyl-CoA hydrolase